MRVVPAIVLLVVYCLIPADALAQTPPDALEVKPAATFLRASPDLQGAVLTRLRQGDRVEVLERGDGDWWRVRAGDPPREGYVHRLVLGAPRGVPQRSQAPPRLPPASPEAPADAAVAAKPSPVRRGPGMLGYAGAGLFVPAARDTFDAVDITGNPLALRGGFEVTRLFKGLYLGGLVERVSETGERAFLTDDGTRFGLGIPLDVELTPIEATIGWRFDAAPAARPARVVPFVGGGVGVLRYRETDPFAEPDEEMDEQFVAYHAVAGADVALARWLGLRLEYRFRYAPDSLGEGGVSAITGDTSLGGSTIAVAVVLGR